MSFENWGLWILTFLIVVTFTISVGSAYAILEQCGVDNPAVAKRKKILSTGLILMSIASVLAVLSMFIGELALESIDNKIVDYLSILTFITGMFLMIYPMFLKE